MPSRQGKDFNSNIMIRYIAAAAATLTTLSKCAVAKGWADGQASGRAGWLALTDPGKVFTALLLLLSCVFRTGPVEGF